MMNLVKVKDYFDIYSGIEKSKVSYSEIKLNNDYIPFIIPSNQYNGTFAGFVDKKNCNKLKIYPKHTIFYGNTGEGSHTFAYVSQTEFVPNNNVSVLIPKIKLSLKEKLFYASCITKNRFKFSYGRIPNRSRMGNIMIPSKNSIPDFVYNEDMKIISKDPLKKCDMNINFSNWKFFSLGNTKFFKIKRAKGVKTNAYEIGIKIPFVTTTSLNNGIIKLVSNAESNDLNSGNVITIANNGSIAESFYQKWDFLATSDITILNTVNYNMNEFLAMFLCTIIKLEKFRFSYGRKWGIDRMKNSLVFLPAKEKNEEWVPDFEYMENFIKTLSYSKYIV